MKKSITPYKVTFSFTHVSVSYGTVKTDWTTSLFFQLLKQLSRQFQCWPLGELFPDHQLPVGSPGHVHVDLRQTLRQVAVTLHLAPPGHHKQEVTDGICPNCIFQLNSSGGSGVLRVSPGGELQQTHGAALQTCCCSVSADLLPPYWTCSWR